MKSKYLSFIVSLTMIILIVVSSMSFSVSAANISSDAGSSYEIAEEDLTQQSLEIFGVEENLYPEFCDPEAAIEEINDCQADFIAKISSYCNIDKLNDSNWEEFRDAFYIYSEKDYIKKRSYTVYGRFSLSKTQYLVV